MNGKLFIAGHPLSYPALIVFTVSSAWQAIPVLKLRKPGRWRRRYFFYFLLVRRARRVAGGRWWIVDGAAASGRVWGRPTRARRNDGLDTYFFISSSVLASICMSMPAHTPSGDFASG
jgi:hypothetical protein